MRGETEEHRRASLAQLWSVVVLLGLLPRVFERYMGTALADPEARRAFVRSLVDGHFADAKSPASKGGSKGKPRKKRR